MVIQQAKIIKPETPDFKLNRRVVGKTLSHGLCSDLAQISLVAPMAAGCIRIVEFNMGAKMYGRVKKLFSKLILSCVGYPHGGNFCDSDRENIQTA